MPGGIVYDGLTSTKLGRVQVAEPLRFDLMHVHDGSPLKEVEWTIPLPVLDQEDLGKQDIQVSKVVPGAQNVDALGSCTCNSGTAHIAERLTAAGKDIDTAKLTNSAGASFGLSGTDGAEDEEFAILLYHLVTDQTGDPATEWPPTDSGSSGLYVAQELIRQGLATSYQSGSGVLGALSLLQSGTVMQGSPWMNSWFTPDSKGFIDGDGSYEAFKAAVKSGVAGGHETTQRAIVQMAQLKNGTVDLHKTVIRVRNSWSAAWPGSLDGDYLVHASTLNYLAQYMDYKAVVI